MKEREVEASMTGAFHMKTTEFDKAVLLEKAIILNGLLANGSSIEKKHAKEEWKKLSVELINAFPHLKANTNGEIPFL